MSAPIAVSVVDGVAELRFSRADRMNVLDVETAQAFDTASAEILADPDVRAVLLSGEGRSFMAGGDLAFFRDADDRAAALRAVIDPTHAALKRLAAAPQITLAAIQGPVAGGGMSVALATDLCIAAESTTLTYAYSRVAAPADCGISWTLPRLVGHRRALDIALSSEPIAAAEALALGLVTRVVPEAELLEAARAMARRLAEGPPLAQARIKALMGDATAFAAQLDAEREAFAACAATQDFEEALSAFFGKRAPHFAGR